MAWVVDTAVLIDVFEADAAFGLRSARCLDRHRAAGLVVCPVSYVEFAPACNGDPSVEEDFLGRLQVNWLEPWVWRDTATAHRLWHDHIRVKRGGAAVKRPIADILIASFAHRFDGLITRNAAHFRRLCPELKIVEP